MDAAHRTMPATTETKGHILPQMCAALIASVGQYLCGMSSGYTSPALSGMRRQLNLTSDQESFISALFPLGSVCGGLVIPLLVDRYGRRASFVFSSLCSCSGWLTVAYARSAAVVMVGRFLQGLSCSASFSVLPNYIGEVSEPRVRGLLGIFIQLGFCGGILTEFLVGKYVSWDWLAVVSACVAAGWLPLIGLLPESPLFLVMKRRGADAAAALRRLRGPQFNVACELAQTERYASDVLSQRVHARQLLERQYLRPLLVAMGLFFFQPASGNDALTFFTVDILEAVHSQLEPYTMAIVASATWIPASLVSAWAADVCGRRPLLLISQLVCAGCLLALGIFFHLQTAGTADVSAIGWLPLTCVILFNPAFAVGLGLMPWVLLGEMFAPEMRGICSSIAIALTSTVTTLVTLCFHWLVQGLGRAGTFWLFAAITATGLVFTLVCVYETRGKSLEQITLHYKQGTAKLASVAAVSSPNGEGVESADASVMDQVNSDISAARTARDNAVLVSRF